MENRHKEHEVKHTKQVMPTALPGGIMSLWLDFKACDSMLIFTKLICMSALFFQIPQVFDLVFFFATIVPISPRVLCVKTWGWMMIYLMRFLLYLQKLHVREMSALRISSFDYHKNLTSLIWKIPVQMPKNARYSLKGYRVRNTQQNPTVFNIVKQVKKSGLPVNGLWQKRNLANVRPTCCPIL